jgi:hypothetical protein
LRYFASPALSFRRWADELVAFDGRQARTHLLSSVSAEVMSLVMRMDDGCALADIEAHLFGSGDAGAVLEVLSPGERDALLAIVADLTCMGLLESRPA